MALSSRSSKSPNQLMEELVEVHVPSKLFEGAINENPLPIFAASFSAATDGLAELVKLSEEFTCLAQTASEQVMTLQNRSAGHCSRYATEQKGVPGMLESAVDIWRHVFIYRVSDIFWCFGL
jgi:hypothetical protein